MTIDKRTMTALDRLAEQQELIIDVKDGGAEIAVKDDPSYPSLDIEIHRVPGGWIIARWEQRNAQWKSSDLRNPEQGYCYSFARSLEGLVSVGIHVYRSPTEAIRYQLKRRYD